MKDRVSPTVDVVNGNKTKGENHENINGEIAATRNAKNHS